MQILQPLLHNLWYRNAEIYVKFFEQFFRLWSSWSWSRRHVFLERAQVSLRPCTLVEKDADPKICLWLLWQNISWYTSFSQATHARNNASTSCESLVWFLQRLKSSPPEAFVSAPSTLLAKETRVKLVHSTMYAIVHLQIKIKVETVEFAHISSERYADLFSESSCDTGHKLRSSFMV